MTGGGQALEVADLNLEIGQSIAVGGHADCDGSGVGLQSDNDCDGSAADLYVVRSDSDNDCDGLTSIEPAVRPSSSLTIWRRVSIAYTWHGRPSSAHGWIALDVRA